MTAYPLFLITTSASGALAPWQHYLRIANWFVGLFGLVLAWIVLFAYIPPAIGALRAGRRGRETK
jgi:hypothetical protein